MDGDGQNDPAFLPKLVEALEAAGPKVGIAAGQRLKRTDTQLKRLASRFANGLRESILHDGTRDSGCGLKAIRTDLFRSASLFRRLAPLSAGAGACARVLASSIST